MAGARLQKIGEKALWEALKKHNGRVQPAALELGVRQSSLQKALETWAKHVGDEAKKLREADGYTFGRPGEVDRQVSAEQFLKLWEEHDRKVFTVAKVLGVDRYAVRRLARLYSAPGAPPPRARRRKDDG
jgi:predicted hydrocarbon binding protein